MFQHVRNIPQALRPRPDSGNLARDAFFLVLVAALQFSLLADIGANLIYIDLVTSWLAISCVFYQSLWRKTFLCMFGALIMETHATVPAGFYICSYWIMANIIHQLRDTLSWRHLMPWLATLALGLLWIQLWEFTVLMVQKGPSFLSWMYAAQQIGRWFISALVGLCLCIYVHWTNGWGSVNT